MQNKKPWGMGAAGLFNRKKNIVSANGIKEHLSLSHFIH